MKTAVFAATFAALGALLAGGAVWAQTPPQITACVERATGYFKLGSGCGQNLTWNTQGPQGPAGPVGPQGPPGAAAAAFKPTTVVYANSAINKASAHSVTAQCPAGATGLFGGAGLITPGKADAAQIRITYSRLAVRNGVPSAWSAGAIKIAHDWRPGQALVDLAIAIRSQLVAHHLYSHHDSPPEIYADAAEQWSDATPGRWAKAIAQAEETTSPPPATIWGVQAWVACGT